MTENEILDCPYYLLTRASLAVTALLKQDLSEAGFEAVRPAFLGALMCLWREDGLKAGELGRCAGLEPSTTTGLLDRMERDGLVERRPDPDDRRAQRIHLTDEGWRAKAAMDSVVAGVLERMTRGISETQVEVLKETLRQILANATR